MCGITYYGRTLTKAHCKNRISKNSLTADVQLLELLAQRPADLSILASLKEIARLLLCVRNHQCKEEDQVQPLAKRWYDNCHDSGVIGRHVRNSRAEIRQLDHPLYPELNPVDRTSTPLTPMDVETAVAEPPSIEMEQLPSLGPDHIRDPNANKTRTPVILRALGREDGNSRTDCLICEDNSADDVVYLQCERCRRSIPLGRIGVGSDNSGRGSSLTVHNVAASKHSMLSIPPPRRQARHSSL